MEVAVPVLELADRLPVNQAKPVDLMKAAGDARKRGCPVEAPSRGQYYRGSIGHRTRVLREIVRGAHRSSRAKAFAHRNTDFPRALEGVGDVWCISCRGGTARR